MGLTSQEEHIYGLYQKLHKEAGSHSPSVHKLINSFPEIKINIDACFLCNPYAFEIFMDLYKKIEIEPYLKFYPPQNREIAENISKYIQISADRILIGNGAIELIEAFFKMLKKKKVMIVQPTFSAYYETAMLENEVIPYLLKKENSFKLEISEFIEVVSVQKPDVIVIVNPNNPTGTLVTKWEIKQIHQTLLNNQILIIDESFIKFAETDESMEEYSVGFDNIIIIRSLSKDFGVAGIRIGYGIIPERIKYDLSKNAFLWNSNGLAFLFSQLLTDENFISLYKQATKRYNEDKAHFFKKLLTVEGIRVYPSSANFFLIETGISSEVVFTKLLFQEGIYSRILNDKIGLDGQFIRVASKNSIENAKIINALKSFS